jgi:hypothetical protein
MTKEVSKVAFTITVDFLYELIEEAENQVAVLEMLLQDFLQGVYGDHDLLAIAIEILWANNSLLRLLDQEIETAVLRRNEKSGEEEFLLSEITMAALQQFVLSKHYAIVDLGRRSYSISLH